MSSAQVVTTIRVSGFDEATRHVRAFGRELKKLDGAKARIEVEVVQKSPASNPMIVDASVVNAALVEGMQLSPGMLADSINNGKILPDKMAMFIAGLNRELMKLQTRHKGEKTVIRSRSDYLKVYGAQIKNPPQFLYFKSAIGQPLNGVVTNVLTKSMFR